MPNVVFIRQNILLLERVSPAFKLLLMMAVYFKNVLSQRLLQFEVNFNKVAFQKFYQIYYAVHRLPLLPTHEFEGQKFCEAVR